MMRQSLSVRRHLCRLLCLAMVVCVCAFICTSPVAAELATYNIVPITAEDGEFSLLSGTITTNGLITTDAEPLTGDNPFTDWSVSFSVYGSGPFTLAMGDADSWSEARQMFVGLQEVGVGREWDSSLSLGGHFLGELPVVMSWEFNPELGGVPNAAFFVLFGGADSAVSVFHGVSELVIATREVPEPSSILLLTLGLVAGGGYGVWRRKKRAVPSAQFPVV